MKPKHMLTEFPDALTDFAYDLNDEPVESLTAGSDHIVFWRCHVCNGVYKTSPYHKTKEGTKCPYCSKKAVLSGYNDLKTQRPEYLKYWDFDKNDELGYYPDKVLDSYKGEVYWKCEKGHSFKKSVLRMTSTEKIICPVCKEIKKKELAIIKEKKKEERIIKEKENVEREEDKQKELIRISNLRVEKDKERIDNFKRVEKMFDYEANKKWNISKDNIRANDMVCWKCSKNHCFKRSYDEMLKNTKCPICYAEENSIATMYPSIANIYDEEKNGIPATKKIAHIDEYLWWKCKRGHRYIAKLRSVISHKETGCMYCDREKSYYSPIGWSGMHI